MKNKKFFNCNKVLLEIAAATQREARIAGGNNRISIPIAKPIADNTFQKNLLSVRHTADVGLD